LQVLLWGQLVLRPAAKNVARVTAPKTAAILHCAIDDELTCVERVFTRLLESLQRNGRKTT